MPIISFTWKRALTLIHGTLIHRTLIHGAITLLWGLDGDVGAVAHNIAGPMEGLSRLQTPWLYLYAC